MPCQNKEMTHTCHVDRAACESRPGRENRLAQGRREGDSSGEAPVGVQVPGTARGSNFSILEPCLQGDKLDQQSDRRLRARSGLEQVSLGWVRALCP